MSNQFIPLSNWFEVSKDIIADAKNHIDIEDFKIKSKLKPYSIGESYTYRMDVLQQLINAGVIILVDNKLGLGDTKNVAWMEDSLKLGYSEAWNFLENVEGLQSESKKFDYQTLKEIGDTGELFIIESIKKQLSPELHEKVIHVAKTDDTKGFDIYSPSIKNSEQQFKIEAKTSTKNLSNRVEFFLSRNEFEVGRKNRNWCIVFVLITEGIKKVIGHIYCYQIESRLPKDVDKTAIWQNCKVNIEYNLLRPGLP